MVVKLHPKLKKVAHFFNSFPFSPFGDIDDKSWIEYTKKVPVKESFKTFCPTGVPLKWCDTALLHRVTPVQHALFCHKPVTKERKDKTKVT